MCDQATDRSKLSPPSLLNGGLEYGHRLGHRRRRHLAMRIVDEPALPPFAEVLAPLAQHAAHVVRDHAILDPQLDDGSVPNLPIRELLIELIRIAGPALIDAWERFSRPSGIDTAGAYRAFSVEHRFEQILVGRTDIIALVAECLAAWAGGLLQVIAHAHGDRMALEALMGAPTGLGRLERIRPVGSDMHSGRQALLLAFTNGQVIHKPRDIRVDVLVGALARAAQLQVHVPPMLPRDQWGWTVKVPASPCATLDGVAQFYRGAGHLLALAQAIGLRDLHAENLVASGPRVVCVDMEACFVFDDGLETGAQPQLSDTGLLPVDTDGSTEDISGLGRPPKICERPRAKVGWSEDGVPEIQKASRTLVHLSHIPSITTSTTDPQAYSEIVESGYAEGIHAIRSSSKALAGLLKNVDDFEIRHVLRPTREYVRVLDQALLDERVTNQRARALFFSQLHAGTPAPWRPLARGEIKALIRGEIPRITSTAGSRTLSCEGEDAADLLPSSGLDQALHQLHGAWRYHPDDGRREIRTALDGQRRC
jgi:class II lanthipeptide synthase